MSHPLHSEVSGAGPLVTLLHGFTTNGEAWSDVRARLETRFRVLTIDLPGHGKSPTPKAGYDFSACADDVVATMRHIGQAPGALIGYSMGGRIALAAALRAPEALSALILESSSPGIEDRSARAERQAADAQLAEQIESTPLPEFLDHWQSLPLFRSQAGLSQEVRTRNRELRLSNTAAGLAASLRLHGTGSQPSYWSALHGLAVPTLLVVGELDEKFRRIADDMQALIPGAQQRVIANVGHSTHLEDPAGYADIVTGFLTNDARDELPAAAEARDGR